uniref:Uncharacterized protein n=1 Tax=Arundo donax TaxID=35708 RepID=A0A0A8YK42_ARUDO
MMHLCDDALDDDLEGEFFLKEKVVGLSSLELSSSLTH